MLLPETKGTMKKRINSMSNSNVNVKVPSMSLNATGNNFAKTSGNNFKSTVKSFNS